MKYRIGNTTDEIAIGQWRPIDKGSLKGFFSLLIYPSGQKILDCRYFQSGERRWFNFPDKEIRRSDGSKPEYIPLVSYLNKEYLNALQQSVLTALKDLTKENASDQKNVKPYPTKTRDFQAESSFDFGEPPF